MTALRVFKGAAWVVWVAIVATGVALVALATGPAGAVTIGWDDEEMTAGAGVFYEDGFTIVGPEERHPGQIAWLRDMGTSPIFSRSLTFTLTAGGLFNAESLDRQGGGWGFLPNGDGTYRDVTYPGLRFSGYASGALVSQHSLGDEIGEVWTTFPFGSLFAGLDTLVVEVLLPWEVFPGMPWNRDLCDPCSFYNIDNVNLVPLSSIPVPAAVWLMGTALGALGLYGRRRRVAPRTVG
jgi:hypothetical protein